MEGEDWGQQYKMQNIIDVWVVKPLSAGNANTMVAY